MEIVAATTRTLVLGILATVAAFVLFFGSIYLITGAIFGPRMGYLVTATGFFGFMIILSALWAFGAPGTPRNLGPRGTLPHWVPVGQGMELESPTYPVVEQYPGGPWKLPGGDAALTAEVEPLTLAIQDFLAVEAGRQLRRSGVEGEITPEEFEVTGIRFATVGNDLLAAATAFSKGGGPEVEVLARKDSGNLPVYSWIFLAGSVLGFAAHLPLLDRAERRRKDVLTGGEQQPWRGPA